MCCNIDDSQFTNTSGKKGGAIHFEGNGNVDDSQFTNKTSGNGGTDSN